MDNEQYRVVRETVACLAVAPSASSIKEGDSHAYPGFRLAAFVIRGERSFILKERGRSDG